jgi:hypothetical protein
MDVARRADDGADYVEGHNPIRGLAACGMHHGFS